MDDLGLAMVPERFSTFPAPLTYTGSLPRICKRALGFFEVSHLFPRKSTWAKLQTLLHPWHTAAAGESRQVLVLVLI